MSKKDVLHIPQTPPPPSRNAEAEDEQESTRRAPPVMQPDEGPGETPSIGGGSRVIKPVGTPGRYPGVSVT
ncbi:MAG: hypothetical protein ABW123_29700 [Cystobacter sp.]